MKIFALQDHQKLIPSDTINRTVFEDADDRTARLSDKFIPFRVAVSVIDPLQPVQITENKGKRFSFSLADAPVECLLILQIDMLVPDTRQRIQIRLLDRLDMLFFPADLLLDIADTDHDMALIMLVLRRSTQLQMDPFPIQLLAVIHRKTFPP